MKAVLVGKDAQRLYVGDWEDPIMGEEDILVSVKATALNRADLLQKLASIHRLQANRRCWDWRWPVLSR